MTLMKQVIIEATAGDLKRVFRERREFEADRNDYLGRIKYMAHAKGYVMVRRPGAMPFVMSESDWRGLALPSARRSP